MRFHSRPGSAWAVNLSPAPVTPAPVQQSALELPGEQKFGLLYLRKAGPDSPANLICRKLDEQGIPFPTGSHWAALRWEGYVTRETNGHRLTPKGMAASSDIIRDLCFKFSIHVYRTSGGRGSGTWCYCSCGTFRSGPHHNDRFGESKMRTAQAGHDRDVTSGRWPGCVVTLADVLRDAAHLKSDSRSGSAESLSSPALAARPENPGTVAIVVAAAVPGSSVGVGHV